MVAFEPDEALLKEIGALPDQPGVYQFFDAKGDVVYIGKALSLKARVRSYWNQSSWPERPKLAVMMPKVVKLEIIVTHSEKEALLLEATLIRQHMPRYNVALKDDRRYPWLAITYDVDFPRLIMVRDPFRYRKSNPKAKVFGPYVESGRMWETVRILRKVFPMRQRKTPFFKDRPCMNFHIGLCLGPCQKLVEAEDYDRMVKQVELFLSGRQTEVIGQLKREMQDASERLEYELAAKIRDRLRALETVIEQQQVFFDDKKVNQDIISEAHTEKLLVVCMMRVREGKLTSSDTVPLPLTDKTPWEEAFRSFADQYYSACEAVALPYEVLLEHEPEDMVALSQVISSKANRVVKVFVPQRGSKTQLIEMAKKNAVNTLELEMLRKDIDVDAKSETMLSKLKEELGIARLPARIECFDISNIQGSDNVASMVVFERAQPKKADYRTFKIRAVEGEPNDFASMKEVVGRRYSRLLEEGKSLPDLIVIDGGKGQLSAALEALTELQPQGLDLNSIDIIGLAKKREEIYFPGGKTPLLLPRRSEALFLLQRVRNEAHRFAVTYHRKRRAKRSLASGLDKLAGIGKARRKLLLDHFGSFDVICKASLEELASVRGIPKKTAEAIFKQLRPATSGEPATADATDAEVPDDSTREDVASVVELTAAIAVAVDLAAAISVQSAAEQTTTSDGAATADLPAVVDTPAADDNTPIEIVARKK